MCGFSGVLFASDQARVDYDCGLTGFRQAAKRVAHRGDTEHNELLLSSSWLSHFRLAFQDVESGRQPMFSSDGQHVIVFNGEIYNHLDLRGGVTRRTGHRFQTRSDTETLIEGWKVFGAEFFEKLEGEYALVILSVNGGSFVAHRDRFGVKPLFLRLEGVDTQPMSQFASQYGFRSSTVEFSSEIKGLASEKEWDREGLLRQFVGLYEPIRTPFKNIIQVPPGAVLEGECSDGQFNCSLRTFPEPIRRNVSGDYADSETAFAQIFSESVSDRLLSDVELGVYLSGGVDSKVVAYELSRLMRSDTAMKSFTVGFSQSGYDESHEALRYAKHFGFDPHLINIDDQALNYSYPLAVQNSELVQPFTNGAAKWWLSLFTRQFVKGVLTGDGADELLCGYPSYRYANWWKFATRGRGEAATTRDLLAMLDQRPLGCIGRDSLYLKRFSAHAKNPWLAGSSAPGTGHDFVASLHMIGVPHPLFGQIRVVASAVLGQEAGDEWLRSQAASIQSWMYAGLESISTEHENPRNSLLLWQNYFAKTHLPTLILNWVGDRMEMANTLEGRTPFLSNKLRKLVAGLPDKLMVSGLRDKVLLRRAYAPKISAGFASTPKKQFNAPFLDSAALIREFHAENIFAEVGLNDDLSLSSLRQQVENAKATDPYMATHLQSTHQTAMSMSIVNRSIVRSQEIQRDEAVEWSYLNKAGPVC